MMLRLPKIEPVDATFAQAAQARWDSLIKPVGSLGRLEQVVSQICAIRGTLDPCADRKRIILFAADHGIVEEGVSAYPQEVTQQMVRGFLMGRAAICVLARSCGIEMQIVDAGMRGRLSLPGLIRMHIRDGSRNFLRESAMTPAEVEHAITAGVQFAKDSATAGVHIIGGGEMGIGNTTSAAAIFAALLDLPPREVTGHGTGINEQTRARKIEVIERALRRCSASGPLEILTQFGGYEIACLTGLYLGAASERLPVVIDGFICTAAATLAMALIPAARDYFIFAHRSAEAGFSKIAMKLQIDPLLNLHMRLGEGTGAALGMQLIDHAVRLFLEMPTFEEAEVSRQVP